MNAGKRMNDLPDDIINLIKEYVNPRYLVFVNKTYYNSYHHLLKNEIETYDNYTKDTVRRDNYFVFDKIVIENIDKWLKNKRYMYKNMIFNNYIYFLLHFCIENNSEKCRELLIDNLTKRDLCRNLHKKKVVKYIKWMN